MNGQYTEKFKMDKFSLIVVAVIVLLLLTLVKLSLMLRNLIRRQIDEQINYMIPIKAIRKRIGIRIKFSK
tara:strand:- start:1351 stop:1560 length:210 start_codon:yes stop_codon:yes gene_type:complete